MSAAAEMPAPNYAALLHAIFAGNELSRGRWIGQPGAPDVSGKVGVEVVTSKDGRGASEEDWQRHLSGRQSLGVSPMREDGTCVWGCIDLDDRGVSHADLVKTVARHKLPLVVCKSKSGAAHLFVFVSEPVPAREMRAALRGMLRVLGLREDTEIFPTKDDRSDGKSPGWLNMPYFEGDQTSRYGVRPGGLPMDLQEFVGAAEEKRVSAAEVARLAAAAAQTLAKSPRPSEHSGGRRATAAEAEAILAAGCQAVATADSNRADTTLNKVVFGLGLLHRDTGISRERCENELTRAWLLRGKDLDDFREVWPHSFDDGATRGEGPGVYRWWMPSTLSAAPQIERIVRILGGEQTTFDVYLHGHDSPINISPAGRLMRNNLFKEQCLEQLKIVYPAMKQAEWDAVIASVPIEDEHLSEELTVEGQFRYELHQWLTNRHAGTQREELLLGRPIFDEDDDRYYFLFPDLMEHLSRCNNRTLAGLQATMVGRMLSALGPPDMVSRGTTTFNNVKGLKLKPKWIAGALMQKLFGKDNGGPIILPQKEELPF